MASVTVELAPDAEARLRDRAARAGETLEEYVRGVVEREAGPPPASTTPWRKRCTGSRTAPRRR